MGDYPQVIQTKTEQALPEAVKAFCELAFDLKIELKIFEKYKLSWPGMVLYAREELIKIGRPVEVYLTPIGTPVPEKVLYTGGIFLYAPDVFHAWLFDESGLFTIWRDVTILSGAGAALWEKFNGGKSEQENQVSKPGLEVNRFGILKQIAGEKAKEKSLEAGTEKPKKQITQRHRYNLDYKKLMVEVYEMLEVKSIKDINHEFFAKSHYEISRMFPVSDFQRRTQVVTIIKRQLVREYPNKFYSIEKITDNDLTTTYPKMTKKSLWDWRNRKK